MAQEFVFEMLGMSKQYGDKIILQNFNLSFYYGAKIGIVGENGAGKSTLLRIMAGIDKDIQGEAKILKGYRALLVPQEPKLNPEKTVRGNLEEAMEPIQKMIERYDEVMAKMGDEMSERNSRSSTTSSTICKMKSTVWTDGTSTICWTSRVPPPCRLV